MTHSSSSVNFHPSPSTVVWTVATTTVATTLLCHGAVLGSSRAIAQSPTGFNLDSRTIPDPISNDNPVATPDGLDFSLVAVEPTSEGTGSVVAPGFPRASLTSSPPTSAPLNSLSFDLAPTTPAPNPAPNLVPNPAPSTVPVLPEGLSASLAHVFEGDTNSLVAIAIGSAEGTRTPDGGKTWAFQGHTDPGNGVWNLGTFSWQHGANSPEEADQKQLARLKKQAVQLHQQAIALGVPWGLAEQLNALDLANQSPSAALNPGGYIERLKQAHDEGLRGFEAILWARTWSYRHPDGTRWNAPGLGNTHHGIRTDQKRRMTAIEQAIAAYSTPTPPPPAIARPLESQSASVPLNYPEPEASSNRFPPPLPPQLREAAIINQLFITDV